MSAKKKTSMCVPKSGAVWRVSSEEATLRDMPRYNGFACGHGPHGAMKYDRAREKRRWKCYSDVDAPHAY